MRDRQLNLCVVGGGFTGVAAAIACLRRLKEPFRLRLVEPSASLGRGVAFGAQHPLHFLNVRTRDLSIHADQPGDFLNWAFSQLDQGENNTGLHEGLAHTFLPRQLFGEYVRQRFFEMIERRKDVELDIVNGVATACVADRGRFQIDLDGGKPVDADVVILATAYGHQALSGMGVLAPYEMLTREQLAKATLMALIGSGLTMVDVLLTARRDGFSAKRLSSPAADNCPSHMPLRGLYHRRLGCLPSSGCRRSRPRCASPARWPKRTAPHGKPS